MKAIASKAACCSPLALAIMLGLNAPQVLAQQASPETTANKPATEADLGKVVVTSNRRKEELKNFAGSVTPITAKELDRIGADGMSGYLARSPGTGFLEMQPGVVNVTIRNVGTTMFIDQGQASTGIFLNDIPMTEPNFSFVTPDLDTFDIQRVEVLRGPQGTAYGSGTLGGAVNIITNTPRFGVAEGRVQLGLGKTDHARGLNHEMKFMVNVPLGEHFAMRTVLATRKQQGYFDNTGTGRPGANDTSLLGGRFLLSWALGEHGQLDWTTVVQSLDNDDGFGVRSDRGRYELHSLIPSTRTTKFRINNLKYTHSFAPATFTASYTEKKKKTVFTGDLSENGFLNGVLLGGTGTPSFTDYTTIPGKTLELRLTSNSAENAMFDWTVGYFHDQTRQRIAEWIESPGAAATIERLWSGAFFPGVGKVGAPDDKFFYINANPVGTEQAFFGEVNMRFADKFKLTLGGRYYRTKVQTSLINAGLLYAFPPGSGNAFYSKLDATQKENGFSPKVVLSYRFNDNNMIYGLYSKGFRYGGPNPNPPGSTNAPATFGSDSLQNYELGWRTSNAGNTFMADVTAYQINWSNMQLRQFTPIGLAYQGNVGDARLRGIEASATWRPNRNFDWSTSLTISEAKLANDLKTGGGAAAKGTSLPGASKYRLSTVATYTFDGDMHPFVTAAYRHNSKAPSDLFTQTALLENNGFGVLDLRGGFSTGAITWTGYVNNATNKYGYTAVEDAYVGPGIVNRLITQPRTYGVLMDWKF